MIVSPRYGPQLDVTDGTIGELQLVRRFVITCGGEFFGTRQGRYTYATRDEAQSRADAIQNEPTNIARKLVPGYLQAAEWWCYPEHFDPVAPAPESCNEAKAQPDIAPEIEPEAIPSKENAANLDIVHDGNGRLRVIINTTVHSESIRLSRDAAVAFLRTARNIAKELGIE